MVFTALGFGERGGGPVFGEAVDFEVHGAGGGLFGWGGT